MPAEEIRAICADDRGGEEDGKDADRGGDVCGVRPVIHRPGKDGAAVVLYGVRLISERRRHV